MTKDLENTIAELGEGYRPFVERLQMAYAPVPDEGMVAAPPHRRFSTGWRIPLLSAAAVSAALLGAAALFHGETPAEKVYAVRATDVVNEYRLAIVRDDKAVQEMLRTQRPDGGWANDFLTRQNAAALRLCPDEKAQIAYRRAVRNLRLRHR